MFSVRKQTDTFRKLLQIKVSDIVISSRIMSIICRIQSRNLQLYPFIVPTESKKSRNFPEQAKCFLQENKTGIPENIAFFPTAITKKARQLCRYLSVVAVLLLAILSRSPRMSLWSQSVPLSLLPLLLRAVHVSAACPAWPPQGRQSRHLFQEEGLLQESSDPRIRI